MLVAAKLERSEAKLVMGNASARMAMEIMRSESLTYDRDCYLLLQLFSIISLAQSLCGASFRLLGELAGEEGLG